MEVIVPEGFKLVHSSHSPTIMAGDGLYVNKSKSALDVKSNNDIKDILSTQFFVSESEGNKFAIMPHEHGSYKWTVRDSRTGRSKAPVLLRTIREGSYRGEKQGDWWVFTPIALRDEDEESNTNGNSPVELMEGDS